MIGKARAAGYLLGTALLAGCAGPLTQSAITSNLVQEDAHNAYLVLNIARAYERMPMHFTQVNMVRAGRAASASATRSSDSTSRSAARQILTMRCDHLSRPCRTWTRPA
ncbi:hypothetical protein [Pseudoduganella chitinolytica]|uniref:Uncharacterized protein n=1 Tax=Pseudoduganella chitinolytica TaxID=34070 RepID=A0ABY8B615_9BURK|nr:hypothetical protein [Pseudoduganella chitinolytica]WEF31366.1 hypothetical protein PX653_18105 [Pseudoduganella chitinolytica]